MSQLDIKIRKLQDNGSTFRANIETLYLGGVRSAKVDELRFELPEEWKNCTVTLHVQRLSGTKPDPQILDENNSALVDRRWTLEKEGTWMLLAINDSGYTAMTKPGKYTCYDTIDTDTTTESITPSIYEQFVAEVTKYAKKALESMNAAKTSEEAAAKSAKEAANSAASMEESVRVSGENAKKAANSAAAAKKSEEAAAKSAEASENSAKKSAESESASKASAGKAKDSEEAAKKSEDAAALSETNAAASEERAKTSETARQAGPAGHGDGAYRRLAGHRAGPHHGPERCGQLHQDGHRCGKHCHPAGHRRCGERFHRRHQGRGGICQCGSGSYKPSGSRKGSESRRGCRSACRNTGRHGQDPVRARCTGGCKDCG